MNLIKTVKTFNKRLNEFTTSAKAINDELHVLFCSAAMLADINNDGDNNVDRFRRILLAMPRSMRQKEAAHWLRTMFPVSVKITPEDISVKMLTGKQAAKHPGWQHELAQATPFWELSKGKDPAPFNPIARLESLAKQLRAVLNGEKENPLKGIDNDRAASLADQIDTLTATFATEES